MDENPVPVGWLLSARAPVPRQARPTGERKVESISRVPRQQKANLPSVDELTARTRTSICRRLRKLSENRRPDVELFDDGSIRLSSRRQPLRWATFACHPKRRLAGWRGLEPAASRVTDQESPTALPRSLARNGHRSSKPGAAASSPARRAIIFGFVRKTMMWLSIRARPMPSRTVSFSVALSVAPAKAWHLAWHLPRSHGGSVGVIQENRNPRHVQRFGNPRGDRLEERARFDDAPDVGREVTQDGVRFVRLAEESTIDPAAKPAHVSGLRSAGH